MKRLLGVAVMAAVVAGGDALADAQRKRPTLLTRKLPKVAPGASLWAHVFWRGGTVTATSLRVTVKAPKDYVVEYPDARSYTAPSGGQTLDDGELDFTSFKVTTPVTAGKENARLELTLEWVADGKKKKRKHRVRLPVRPNRGDAAEMVCDVVGPLAPGGGGWVHIDFEGRERVTGFKVVVTDPGACGIVYPGGRTYTGLAKDSTLDIGEMDYCAFRVETYGLAEGWHDLALEMRYTEDGETAETVVPLTVSCLVSTDTRAITPSLTTSAQQVTSTDRSLTLRLAAGPAHGYKPFQMLGSLAGTDAPTTVGGMSVPLTTDSFFLKTLRRQSVRPVADGVGTLDESGRANATFKLRQRDFPALTGSVYHFAYVVYGDGGVEFVSDAVPVVVGR